MTKNLSLKSLAESKADGIQKATYFKVRPDVVELKPGFNLREEGAELTEHIERLYHAMTLENIARLAQTVAAIATTAACLKFLFGG